MPSYTLCMTIRIQRVYDTPRGSGELRLLVDRLWPRGISKQEAHIDVWAKELAPSTALRQWFHSDTDTRYAAFAARYARELAAKRGIAGGYIGKRKRIVLVTAAKDIERSHIPTLARFLQRSLG